MKTISLAAELKIRSREARVDTEMLVAQTRVGAVEVGKSGWVWYKYTHTTMHKIDNQQGPTVEHRELYSILCNNLYEKRIWKRWIYVYV